MKTKISKKPKIYSEEIYLKFDSEDVQQSYPILDKYPSNGARNRALLNQLSIKVLTTKLASELPLPQSEKLIIRDEIDHTKIWEFLNGSALSLGSTSIVIIPEEIADRDSELEELSVPQEWVDIPNLAASYYIPVQINLDEEYLVIKGYCTHQQLKKGRYKKISREYAIDEDQLINDLSIMLDAIAIGADEKDTINPLKPLSEVEVKNLMREVGESAFYSPRLRISSEKWLPFLANNLSVVNDQKTDVPVNLISKVINLSKWLAEDFSETIKTGWQSLEDIFGDRLLNPAFKNIATAKRAKLIKLSDYAVILLVDVSPDEGNEVKVKLGLYPAQDQSILPENLKVKILEQGKTVEILAKEHPKDVIVIQEMFYLPNEEFSVEFTLNSEIFIESFAI